MIFKKKNPSEIWTHPPTSIVNSDFWNCFFFPIHTHFLLLLILRFFSSSGVSFFYSVLSSTSSSFNRTPHFPIVFYMSLSTWCSFFFFSVSFLVLVYLTDTYICTDEMRLCCHMSDRGGQFPLKLTPPPHPQGIRSTPVDLNIYNKR